MYGWANHRVALDDLIAFAWSAPMRDLATQAGLSDVGLKKLLKSHGVSGPPQGHWNRVRAGRRVSEPPDAPARGPGQRPYIHVNGRLAHLPEAPLPSSAGPFASAKVPEDLEELRARELKAIGRAASAAKIAVTHPTIRSLLGRDEKERAKAAADRWYTAPILLYESPYEKRRLRILNAIFLTLHRREHRALSDQQDYHTEFSVVIGDTHLLVKLGEACQKAGAHDRYNVPRPNPKRSASLKLRLSAGNAAWQDDGSGALESKIAEISAGLIVKGERAYREHLRWLEEQAERERVEAERRRQERLRKANSDRIAALIESGRLLAEADHLRKLIAQVASAVENGRLDLSRDQLTEWYQWANQEADKLDPVISGQVRTHLLPLGAE